jgi:hypothetical protein
MLGKGWGNFKERQGPLLISATGAAPTSAIKVSGTKDWPVPLTQLIRVELTTRIRTGNSIEDT